MSKTFYAYDFTNTRRLLNPIKIEKNGRAWTSIYNEIMKQIVLENKLF